MLSRQALRHTTARTARTLSTTCFVQVKRPQNPFAQHLALDPDLSGRTERNAREKKHLDHLGSLAAGRTSQSDKYGSRRGFGLRVSGDEGDKEVVKTNWNDVLTKFRNGEDLDSERGTGYSKPQAYQGKKGRDGRGNRSRGSERGEQSVKAEGSQQRSRRDRDREARDPQMDKAEEQEGKPRHWSPTKKLTYSAMAGLRELHAQDPERFTRGVLAEKFGISFEAVSRILKSRYGEGPSGAGAAEGSRGGPGGERGAGAARKFKGKWDKGRNERLGTSPVPIIRRAYGIKREQEGGRGE